MEWSFSFQIANGQGQKKRRKSQWKKSQMEEGDPGKSNLNFIQIYKNVQN
jgi:hypothetical protein